MNQDLGKRLPEVTVPSSSLFCFLRGFTNEAAPRRRSSKTLNSMLVRMTVQYLIRLKKLLAFYHLIFHSFERGSWRKKNPR